MPTDLTSRYAQSSTAHRDKQWAIHHTATPTPSHELTTEQEIEILDGIDRFHREKRGFAVGIGYHVLVFPSGRSYRVGREGTQRAHVANRNHEFDGLCFVGTFSRERAPSEPALAEAAQVISESGMDVAGGHGDLGSTECPGGWALAQLSDRLQLPPAQQSPPLSARDRATVFMWLTNERLAPGVRLVPRPKRGRRRVYEIEIP